MDMPDDCGGCRKQPPPLDSTVFGIGYATEMQTDFRELNWVNLLKLNFSQTLCNGILIDLGSISNTKHARNNWTTLVESSNIEKNKRLNEHHPIFYIHQIDLPLKTFTLYYKTLVGKIIC